MYEVHYTIIGLICQYYKMFNLIDVHFNNKFILWLHITVYPYKLNTIDIGYKILTL